MKYEKIIQPTLEKAVWRARNIAAPQSVVLYTNESVLYPFAGLKFEGAFEFETGIIYWEC